MKKYLAVAVILLFIGLAVAPSINANISKEALVEFTTEVCGLDGRKQTVKLTQKEIEELIQLFGSIEERLNNSDSMDEAVEIFDEAILELDRFGVLPNDMSVKDVQRVVTGRFKNPITMKVFEGIQDRLRQTFDVKGNRFCLISGVIEGWTLFFFNLLTNFLIMDFIIILTAIYGLGGIILWLALSPIIIIPLAIDALNPICLYRIIRSERACSGKIVTFGLNGLKIWQNKMIGAIYHWFFEDTYPAWAIGFTGLKLQLPYAPEDVLNLFLGFAYWVKIEEID